MVLVLMSSMNGNLTLQRHCESQIVSIWYLLSSKALIYAIPADTTEFQPIFGSISRLPLMLWMPSWLKQRQLKL